MICTACGHCSQHVCCPYCGDCQMQSAGNIRTGLIAKGAIRTGFDILDPLGLGFTPVDPLDLRHKVPQQMGYDTPVETSNLPSPNEISSSLPSIPNPFSGIKNPFSGVIDSVQSTTTVLKYVVIGGAIFLAVMAGYVVIKWIPIALGLAGSSAHESIKAIPHILKAAV